MANRYLTSWRPGSLAEGSPFGGGLFDLHRQVNRLFDQMFERDRTGGTSLFPGGLAPALDLHADEKRVEITAELPGVREQDINITVENGMLTLSGEKRSERNDETGYSERSYGRFERSIALPSDVDEDRATADFRDGVLRVSIPRSEAKSRGKRIAIGGSQQSRIEAQNDFGISTRQEAAAESRDAAD
ncbi:MAG: Hsp20/alpha crystallin family protein, partial [Cypionkella sp.]